MVHVFACFLKTIPWSIPYFITLHRLGKKKKFLNPKEMEVKLGNPRLVDSRHEKEQYMQLCR